MTSVVLGELTGSSRDRRIQIRLDSSSRLGPVFELREQHHADGMGWFDQRCLTLDANQVSQLLSLLGGRGVSASLDAQPLAEILAFPGPAVNVSPRSPTERRADAG